MIYIKLKIIYANSKIWVSNLHKAYLINHINGK